MSNDFKIDLYENGFFIQSNTEKLLLKGMKWEYRSWEQEPDSLFIHVHTNTKIILLILRNNQCILQDQTEFLISITVPHMVFQIVKNHILELKST